jgi:kynurenine formamidase
MQTVHPLLDISVTIRPRMPIYEGDPGGRHRARPLDSKGDTANVSRLQLGSSRSPAPAS